MGYSPSSLVVLKLNLFFLVLWLSVSISAGEDSEKSALLLFKSSVSDSSGLLSSWDSAGDHCSWHGVSCDSDSRVVAFNVTGNGNRGNSYPNNPSPSCYDSNLYPLYGFGVRTTCVGVNGKLVGKLSNSIAELRELRVLSLPYNGFSGEIPNEVWESDNLEVIDLEGNSMTGKLPARFGKNLRILNLGFNKIVGEIPSSLSNCPHMEILNLAGNRVNGTVPGFLGQLRGVYLSYNWLGGEIPTEIGEKCGTLEHLDLSGNFLVRSIPASLGNCSELRTLLLYSNLLELSIPAELGRLRKLQVLDVSRNSLSGFVPHQLGNCSQLSALVLSNQYNPLPDSNLTEDSNLIDQLASMYDDFNFFQGGLPEEVTALPRLRILWSPRSTLEGRFPSNWGSCAELEMVNLGQNFFAGGIPSALAHCRNLRFLSVGSNKLTGELPRGLRIPCMTMFDVSRNSLSGSIPEYYHNGTCTFPARFEPDQLSAQYLAFFASKARVVEPLQLSEKEGSLLVIHSFGRNNFSGNLPGLPIAPRGSGMLPIVYAFLAGENVFADNFPGHLFEKCGDLEGLILNVSYNKISGSIPKEVGKMCVPLQFLDASGNQISGKIPTSIGNFATLLGLNLSSNSLQGQIPSSLGQLKDMKYLSLAGNNLTGPIPPSLGSLSSLQVLDLASNFLAGEIPTDLADLKTLAALLLDRNELSGQIPSGLANVSTLATFNVSFNNLSGAFPWTDNLIKCKGAIGNPLIQSCPTFKLTDSSNPQARGDPQPYTTSPSEVNTESSSTGGGGGLNSIEIASVTSASAIVSVLLALIVLFFYTRKWNSKSKVGGSTRKEVTVFTDIGVPLSFEHVVRATGGFNASNCIGNGGFGATYKAEISTGVLVAIKRLAVGRFQGIQQFRAEIKTLGRLHHPNLVTLIGYHASETEMFLIYNYLPGGNLERFIQERSNRGWRVLHKIALDVARALTYLHDQCVPRVLHRDVKPSNILLDEDFNAYLSDFGLARLLGTSETHATTGVAGTFGYVAPEYAMTCRVSDKADVYSYGVVLLELVSDKKALDPSFSPYGNGFNIVQWASMLLRQGRAKEFFTSGLWDAGPHDDLVEVLHLAVVCTVDSLSTRPTMRQVVRRLKQLQPPSC